jgi:lysozyme family protein
MEDGRFDVIGQMILRHEGHLANNPNDPGGITNYGISLRYLAGIGSIDPEDGYLYGDMDHDGDIDENDIKLMTPEEALKIYRTQWWDRYQYGRINYLPLAAKVMDFSVNAGPKRAAMVLQAAVNKVTTCAGKPLAIDGSLGNLSYLAINGCSEPRLIMAEMKLGMVEFYNNLKKMMFIDGWIRRTLEDLKVN